MATSFDQRVDSESQLDIEIVVGTYEQVLFGYNVTTSEEDDVELNLSFTDKSHCGSIRSVAVSNEGILASGSADEKIELFDLKSRHEAGTLMKHGGTITHIEFFDEFMISSDDSGMICIWKVHGKTYECLKTLTGHKGAVSSMSVHPTGKLLLSVGHDKTIRTWNLVTAKRAYTTSVHAQIDLIRWSPDGEKYLMVYNGKMDVCSVAKAAPLNSIKLPGKAHSLAFLNMNIVAVGCESGALVFVNINTAEIIHEVKYKCNRIKAVSVKPLDDSQSLLALVTNEGLMEIHTVKAEGDKVSLSLFVASKTALRPVCMELVVRSESLKPVVKDEAKANGMTSQTNVREAAASKPRVKGDNNVNKEPDNKRQNIIEGTSESIKTTVKRTRQRKRKSEAVEANTETGEAEQAEATSPQDVKKKPPQQVKFEEDIVEADQLKRGRSTVRKRRSESTKVRAMDSIKRFVSSIKHPSNNNEEGNPKKAKKHMKPVDSVKIMKQKMAQRAKQNHAKHHTISEHRTSDVSEPDCS